jgi:hypothetical protein
MKFIAINGSPRRGWNTEQLLQKAIDGAKSKGAWFFFLIPLTAQRIAPRRFSLKVMICS